MIVERIAKLGLLIPSPNSVAEWDARLVLPQGVSAHFARLQLGHDTESEIRALKDQVPVAAKQLAAAGVQAIGFACTSGSFIGGMGYDEEVAEAIRSSTGLPAVTTTGAVIDAMRSLGIKRFAAVTPYEEWLNRIQADFFAGNGFEVLATTGLGLPEPLDQEAVSPAKICELALELDGLKPDGFLVACTDFRGLEAVAAIEQATRRPVVSSNQATLWKLMHAVGLHTRITGFGRLFSDEALMNAEG